MATLPFLFILAASASAGVQAPSADRPLLVAEANGDWAILEDVREAPLRLAYHTDGLVTDEDRRAANEADRLAEAEAEENAQRAFEEALDAARRDSDPR